MCRTLLSHSDATLGPLARGDLHIFAGHDGGCPMRAVLAAIVSGLVTEIRESLPSSEDEAGMFVSGMAWGFALFILLLLLVTLGWAKSQGVAL